jgi:phosphoglycerate dehydrogenase-like enzyme
LLAGKVLGVLGAGNIGSVVANLGVAWRMKVLACVEHPSAERAAQFRRTGIQLTSCEELLSQADFVTLHVPLKESNRNLINEETLGYMKQGAYLVNIARGGIVDESALYQALTEGRLGGAALDVHQAEGEGKISPLAALKNVILTPHIGANTIDSQREIGEVILETVENFKEEMSPVWIKTSRYVS